MTPVAASAPSTLRVPPLSVRISTAVRGLVTLGLDPNRLDQVLLIAQTVNARSIRDAVERLPSIPGALELMAEQPRIDREHVDFDALRRLPDGTLGREYTRFLDDHGITPDVFSELPATDDPRASYLMLRLRQTHDLWHVLTGYEPDVRGEILLQAFQYGHTLAPSAFLFAAFGSLRWLGRWPGQRKALREAFARGKNAASLPTFRWEKHWETPVSQLREMLGCPPLAKA